VDTEATPTGWVPVAFGDAQVSVPSTFPVIYPGQNLPCEGTGWLLVGSEVGSSSVCRAEHRPTRAFLFPLHDSSSLTRWMSDARQAPVQQDEYRQIDRSWER
jgi:hypothetical protein